MLNDNRVYREFIRDHDSNADESLKKLRRDRGKVEEIIGQLTFCLEKLGGTVENLHNLLSADESLAPKINNIAELIMGKVRLMPGDALEIVTTAGKSALVRMRAVDGIKEEDLPVHLFIDPEFRYPLTRIAIVERLSDQKKLKEVALKDRLYGYAVAGALAVDKIESPSDLYDVAVGARHDTASLAAARLTDENLLAQLAGNENVCDAVRKVAINKMTNIKALEQLADQSIYVRGFINRRLEGLVGVAK